MLPSPHAALPGATMERLPPFHWLQLPTDDEQLPVQGAEGCSQDAAEADQHRLLQGCFDGRGKPEIGGAAAEGRVHSPHQALLAAADDEEVVDEAAEETSPFLPYCPEHELHGISPNEQRSLTGPPPVVAVGERLLAEAFVGGLLPRGIRF